MHSIFARTIIAAALIAATASPALAEETECTSALGRVTVDNLLVPEGATCTLTGTTIEGSIVVAADATLRASRVSVIGNIQAEGARSVVVQRASTVGGSVQVVQGRTATISTSDITGDILFDEQSGLVRASDNDVGGDIQAFTNTGGVRITLNYVDGNLQCTGNSPAPTGGENDVAGNKENQCENL